MRIIEIGTGYTSIPAKMGAATEIVVEELTKSFLKSGCNVDLIDIEDGKRLLNELPITEVKMPFFLKDTDVKLGLMHKLKRVFYSLSLAKLLRKKICTSNEEIMLHFHNQYNLYFFLKLTNAKIRKKVKIAYTVHSYIWPEEWDKIEKIIKKRYFQEVYCVQNADYVLVLNDKTKEHFVKHLNVSGSKIYNVINGVNTEVYNILDIKEKEEIRKKVGVSGKKVILQIGSVCDRKNQLGALKALYRYLQTHSETIYMYAGGIIDDEYQESINNYTKEKGIEKQVIYVGELCPGNQLNRYYNIADVTIFPSKIESFGLVIIESIATGTPVVLSEEPLFALNEGYKVYTSKEHFVELVDSILNERNIILEGREEVIQKYSWDTVSREHNIIFNS